MQAETCPWCQARIRVPLGFARCTTCGNRLWVTPEWRAREVVRLLWLVVAGRQ